MKAMSKLLVFAILVMLRIARSASLDITSSKENCTGPYTITLSQEALAAEKDTLLNITSVDFLHCVKECMLDSCCEAVGIKHRECVKSPFQTQQLIYIKEQVHFCSCLISINYTSGYSL